MQRKFIDNSDLYHKNAHNYSIKSINDRGVFSGYASVFNIVDKHNDVVNKNAFRSSISRKHPREIRLLWQHRIDEPIGTIDSIGEDSVGLHIQGRIFLDIEKGKEAYKLAKSGIASGLSIGYNVAESTRSIKNGVRTIVKADLVEISIVTFPANAFANINSIKNM